MKTSILVSFIILCFSQNCLSQDCYDKTEEYLDAHWKQKENPKLFSSITYEFIRGLPECMKELDSSQLISLFGTPSNIRYDNNQLDYYYDTACLEGIAGGV